MLFELVWFAELQIQCFDTVDRAPVTGPDVTGVFRKGLTRHRLLRSETKPSRQSGPALPN